MLTNEVARGEINASRSSASPSSDRVSLSIAPLTLAAGLSAAALVIVVQVIAAARYLRPIADDYCLALTAGKGLWAASLEWFRTWTGDLTAVFTNTLFTGLPLVHLPWGVASAVPFLTAALVMLLPVVALLARATDAGWRRVALAAALLAPLLLVAWWSFWWLPADAERSGNPLDVAASVTVWQNINSAYVIPTAGILSFWIWLGLDRRHQRSLRLLAFPFAGLLTGLAGIQLALATAGTVVLLTAVSLLWPRAPIGIRIPAGLLFVIAAGLGIVVSYTSPGARARAEVLGASEKGVSLPLLMDSVLPEALRDWGQSFVHLGAVAAFLLASMAVVLLGTSGVRIRPLPPLVVAGSLALYSLALSAVNRVSEVFAYEAYWHLVPGSAAAFLSVTALAISCGSWLTNGRSMDSGALLGAVCVFGLAAALFFAWGGVRLMTQTITERADRWETGSAPVADINDLEADYAQTCWNGLGEYRETPDRDMPE